MEWKLIIGSIYARFDLTWAVVVLSWEPRTASKKQIAKKKIEKGTEIGREKRTSALVPRGLAARPSRLYSRATVTEKKNKRLLAI